MQSLVDGDVIGFGVIDDAWLRAFFDDVTSFGMI